MVRGEERDLDDDGEQCDISCFLSEAAGCYNAFSYSLRAMSYHTGVKRCIIFQAVSQIVQSVILLLALSSFSVSNV